MELFKSDGTLKKRSALIAHYTDYVVENAKTAWEEVMKVEHEALYPKQLSNPLYDATAEEPVAEFIDNAEYVEYDVWMAETIVIQEAKEAVVVDGLVIAEPSVPEIREAVRKFEAPMVTEEMLDEYLSTNSQYGKTYGELYNGYRISFKTADAMGMLQVKAGFEFGEVFTNIEFSNGTSMPMAVADFPAFAQWFVKKRNGYFL